MASRKTIDELIENINEDIEKASTKEINKIYEELKKILKKYCGWLTQTFFFDRNINYRIIF